MKYKSEIYEVLHQDAVEMFKIGGISAGRMREYDKMCLVPEPKTVKKPEKSPEMGHPGLVTAGI